MKISIISLSYNNGSDIERTFQSVFNQSYKDIQYIVVDGGSTDQTAKVVKKHVDNISIYISEPDNGIYDAINKGITRASGDIVGLIHAGDELYDSEVLSKIAIYFQENEIDALYGHSKIFNEDGTRLVRVNKSPPYQKKLFRQGWFPSHQSFYAKRELFERYGNYDLQYKIAADYELLLRFLYIHHVPVALLDEFLIRFRTGGTSTKSIENIISLNRECYQAWKNNGLKMPFYTIPMKLLRKITQITAAKLHIF